MKDYLVDVTIHIEMRGEDHAQVTKDVTALISRVADENPEIVGHFFVDTPTCVGGDNEIATDLMHETGLPYETCETFMRSLTSEQREGLDAQQMAEMMEHKI